MKQYNFYQPLNIGLDVTTSEEIYYFLSKNKYIQRDFNQGGKIVCTIGLYKDEDDIELGTDTIDLVRSRIEEYRSLFKGLRVGAMGNKQLCIEYLSKFMTLNNKTFDEILDVTKWYLGRTQYPKNADNFIYHTDSNSGKEKSLLETIFEEYSPELEQKFI